MVEQRLARLQADRHAGPVNLGQDIAGQPEFQVSILRPVEPRTGRGGQHRGLKRLLSPIVPAQPQEFGRVERIAQFGRQDRQRAGITRLAAPRERQQGGFGPQRLRGPVGLGIDRAQSAQYRPAQSLRHHTPQPVFAVLELVAAVPGKGLIRAVAR